jgi:dienelactone hydrolase
MIKSSLGIYRARFGRLLGLLIVLVSGPYPVIASVQSAPETVYFASADGRTELVGYLFRPLAAPDGGGVRPAIVMLHGRGGPYSSNVHETCTTVARAVASPCNAGSLSQRHRMWGEFWAARGYLALLVDSFGPRGRAHGYGRFTHDDPDREPVNERTVRPLDGQAAAAWLAGRPDVDRTRILLQGWSNGGSTTLNAMLLQARQAATGSARFRAALAFYPGCGPKALISRAYEADAPIAVFLGSDDEEVSPTTCVTVLRGAHGGPVNLTLYPGATHDFDDPGTARQSVAANRRAKEDAMARAAALFDSTR